jgi:dTDP-4-dehydrorhamnose reductase
MKKLLIGASGLLGKNLLFEDETLRPSSSELNILDYSSISKFISGNKHIDAVVLCAAYTNVSKSNIEKDKVFNLNVLGVCNLIQAINNRTEHVPTLFYISTDYVFSGEHGGYKTTDPINPVANNYYATTKALGECSARSYAKTAIIRTSFCKSDGWPYEFAFDDQFTSRDRVEIIAPMISDIVNKNNEGIYHVGTDRKSVFDLAKQIDSKVKPISRLSIKNVNIPFDTSLI